MERTDYELGEDVTAHARPRKAATDVAISFRLSSADLRALERLAVKQERSLSWVMRKAVQSYLSEHQEA